MVWLSINYESVCGASSESDTEAEGTVIPKEAITIIISAHLSYFSISYAFDSKDQFVSCFIFHLSLN